MTSTSVLPPYPHSTLGELHELAKEAGGPVVDLSIGTPCDPPPSQVLEILGSSGAERGYPPSPGTPRFREAAAAWMERRFGVVVDATHVAACVGTKELVVGLPSWLRLLRPDRSLVLHPRLAYPSYAMGAFLAGGTATAFAEQQRSALCRWVNSPSNPTGELDDLAAASTWASENGTPVLSDECYAELTWRGRPRTILEHGSASTLALHSLSKRSNLAGLRAGFFAGDPALLEHLIDVRRHAGLMVPGPVQEAAAAALDDDTHAAAQADRYRSRLERVADGLRAWGVPGVDLPAGGIYLWVAAPDGDGWSLARALAEKAGAIVAPGSLYGEAGAPYVRIAMTAPDEQLDQVLSRLAQSSF